jgi:hypothetical protein
LNQSPRCILVGYSQSGIASSRCQPASLKPERREFKLFALVDDLLSAGA